MSLELRLKPDAQTRCAVLSLHKHPSCTTVDALRRKVQAGGQPEASPACHVLAARMPGVAWGCAGLHLSRVTGHATWLEAPGDGAQSEVLRPG